MEERLVLIGNGMAGVRTIEEILKRECGSFDITIIGEEAYPNYNRIMLSNILQGEKDFDGIIINEPSWYEDNGIHWINHDPAVDIDPKAQVVTTKSGQKVPYDKLIIATGSRGFVLPLLGNDLEGVMPFRTIDDTKVMMEAAKNYQKAAVIGGGLLGLEAADGLVKLGMDTTVIHLEDWLMETQLDQQAGEMLQADLENRGIKFSLGTQTTEIFGEDRVQGLKFADGSQLEADLVIMSVGIVPEIQLGQQAGLETNRGIIVDQHMQTSDPNIFAVGECTEFNGRVYGLVAPLYEQGRILADYLTGCSDSEFADEDSFTSLKVSGVDLFSAGVVRESDEVRSISAMDGIHNTYKRVFIKDEKVVGVVLYGDVSEGQRYYNILRENENIDSYTPVSLLHVAGEETVVDVMAWDDSEMICGCNGITKGNILTAIRDQDLKNTQEVMSATTAGASCGRCIDLIDSLVYGALDGEVSEVNQGMCECTDFTTEQVRIRIGSRNLKTIQAVYDELAFRNPEGCPVCRPALNFYLQVARPKEYVDELESRPINERMHANIQSDGTYGIVPRMRAGQTTADQLIRLGEVAKQFDVPLIKVTGAQRVGLYGIEKQDLPAVWEALDMEAAQAYAKAVRSVKACMGAPWCRFGTQDSLGLGERLERAFEYIDTPHKFKFGVSACPRSCVESGVKDFGVIGVENGFQILIGGNGGTEVIEAVELATVETADEVVDIAGAMLQYYRETGNYNERTAPWVKRLGFERVKEVLLDPEHRRQLNERLRDVEKRRREPWKQIVEDQKIQEEVFAVTQE